MDKLNIYKFASAANGKKGQAIFYMQEEISHNDLIKKISNQIKNWARGDKRKKLRFRHGSTNSTRSIEGEFEFIETSNLNRIIQINTEEKWVLVEPNVPMDILVEETLKYNLVPPVVMEFPGITVGGGIQGAGLESSSFKFGQFNDTCLEFELITGDGRIINASASENQDLFYGISGSYGTLAVLTLAKIKLIPSAPFVKITFKPYQETQKVIAVLKEESTKEYDFLEGIIYSPARAVIITGNFSVSAPTNLKTFSKNSDPWFYKYAETFTFTNQEFISYVPIKEYLFRFNKGAFWMGEYAFPLFRVPNNKVTKFLLNPLLSTRRLYKYMHVANVTQNYYIQDFYYPFNSALNYLNFNQAQLDIYPIWLCPVKAMATAQKLSPHYSDANAILLNIGIYGQSEKFKTKPTLEINRATEQLAASLGGRKMFYAHSYYPKKEFWQLYDYSWYSELRRKYGAENVFPEIWEKIIVTQHYKPKVAQNVTKQALKDIKKRLKRVFL